MNDEDLKIIISQLKEWGNIYSASRLLVKNICITNKWPYGEIWIPDKTETYMTWMSHWAVNEDEFEAFSRFSSMHKFAKGIGLVGNVWQKRKVVLSNKIHEDNNFLRSEASVKNRLSAAIGIPILKNEDVIMILMFFKNILTKADEEIAEQIFSYSHEIGNLLN